jgi:hypothetical protein
MGAAIPKAASLKTWDELDPQPAAASSAHHVADSESATGLTEPVGIGPETVGTSRTGSGRFPTGPNSKYKFEFKKWKKSHKILKNISRCVEFNGVNNFQIFVCLV